MSKSDKSSHRLLYWLCDISTVHITRADGERLTFVRWNANAPDQPVLVPIRNDPADPDGDEIDAVITEGFSESFVALCRKLRAEGFDFLRFHSEGEVYPDLPQYDW